MLKFGLLGKNISYSLSPKLHKIIFEEIELDGDYVLYDTAEQKTNDIEQIKELLNEIKNKELVGINVTIPYKETVINFLDDLDITATEIGAVNTIVLEDGRLKGYNTDYFGIKSSLEKIFNLQSDKGLCPLPPDLKAFILGTGGSSKAVQQVMKDFGCDYVLVSRDKKDHTITYEEFENVESGGLLINATPISVSEHIGTKFKVIFDLKYNELPPKYLRGDQIYLNGLYMLTAQGIKAEEIWLGEEISEEVSDIIFKRMLL